MAGVKLPVRLGVNTEEIEKVWEGARAQLDVISVAKISLLTT